MKTRFRSVDEYVAAQPDAARAALERVRKAIRKAIPRVEESISYNMPTYKVDGVRIVHLAAWKTHFSLYGATPAVLEQFGDELRAYEIEKGTIRFPLDEPVPEKLIERIAKFRASEATARALV